MKWDRDDGGGASLTNGKDELTASTPVYRRDRLVAVAHSLRNVREPSKDSGETVDEGASSIVGGRSFQLVAQQCLVASEDYKAVMQCLRAQYAPKLEWQNFSDACRSRANSRPSTWGICA